MYAQLHPVRRAEDIFPVYRSSPIAELLAYHNLDKPHGRCPRAELLIGMCIDYRMRLNIPERFAFIMRAGGANFRGMEFQISLALALGGLRAIALIAHDQCRMENLHARRDAMIAGLIENAGWSREDAEKHFDEEASRFEIGDPADFVRSQTVLLRQRYPTVLIAPLMYRLNDGMLYQIEKTEEP